MLPQQSCQKTIRPLDIEIKGFFVEPNHAYCIAEPGYLADQVRPKGTREYSNLGSCLDRCSNIELA